MIRSLFILFLFFSFTHSALAVDDCEYAHGRLGASWGSGHQNIHPFLSGIHPSPQVMNKCFENLLKDLVTNKKIQVKSIGNKKFIIPLEDGKIIQGANIRVIKFKKASPSEKKKWGTEEILIHKSTHKDTWKIVTGGNGKDRNEFLEDDDIKKLEIDKRLVKFGDQEEKGEIDQCKKTSCSKGQTWNDITCQCEDKQCSEERVQKEKKECSDYLAKNNNQKSYKLEFLAKYDEKSCKCIMDHNPSFVPRKNWDCNEGTDEYIQKAAECSEKTDNEGSYEFVDCKCVKTKKFCDGRYANREEYDRAKNDCNSQPDRKWKWVGCECRDLTTGEKACSYKEKRKMVGSFSSDKMSFNRDKGSEAHWANEPIYRQGPCNIENWLSQIGSTKKDVKHCDEYEKLVIKKNGFENDDFKEKRFFCTKCKDGYTPSTTTTTIEGVNDDFMEQPSYSYISACEKEVGICNSDRDKKREAKCKEKNKREEEKKSGVQFVWTGGEVCDCDRYEGSDDVEPECKDKISDFKLRQCRNRGGEIIMTENGCDCDAACYETIVDKDKWQTGTECVTDGIKLNNSLAELLESADQVMNEECEELQKDANRLNALAAAKEKCAQQADEEINLSGANPAEKESYEKSIRDNNYKKQFEVTVQMTKELKCKPISWESESANYASQIPGLVGGLDLIKDFTYNGAPVTDISKIDCSVGLKYKPLGHDPKLGTFKTSAITGEKCQNLLKMNASVTENAEKFVKSITENKNIPPEQQAKILVESFQAKVFATANREGHGSSNVNHATLSNKRAESMQEFYIKQVVAAAKASGVSIDEKALREKSQSETIAYFGPPDMNRFIAGDPSYEACKGNKTQKEIYSCMVDSHVLKELSQLNSFAQQSKNANLANGFAKKIIDNSGFKEFASKSRPDIDLGQLDLFSDEGKELYGNFLKDLHTTDPKSPKHAVLQSVLDNMKIFDLNASTSGEVNTDKTEQVDVKASCSIFYDDLWKDEPVFTEREVRYGNRPSTVQSFTRECREDYEKMLTTITDDYKKRNPQDYEDLKKELQADFPEDWEKKLNRKMRKMAKKEWKNAKKNTKEVGKALGSERRWRGGSDDKMNYSETYDQVIQPKVEQENWNNRDYKSRSLNGN